jgi:hypothetical protein
MTMKEFVEKYMEGLGYDDMADFAEDLFRNSWSRGYARWRVLKDVILELGWDLSSEEGYSKYIDYYKLVFNMTQFTDQAMQQMGLEEIKDIPTMGQVLKHIWHDLFLCPSEVVEESLDRTVIRTLWCGNPAYGPAPFGPHDCIANFHEYYRLVDGGLTRDLGLTGMIEEARKRGLSEEVEHDMPWALCRDGDAPYCLYVMKKKGTPDYQLPDLSDRDKTWSLEHKIEQSGEKTMVYIAKMLDKTIEEVAGGILILYVALDTGGYIPAEITFSKDKGLEMYNRYWLSFLYHWFREAKFELEIGKVANIRELAEIIAFCERKKFIPYQLDDQDGRIVLTAQDDPFAEVSTQFLGMPPGFSYLNAIAAADDAFIGKIVEDSKMKDRAKVTAVKRLVNGDDCNEIVVEEI